MASLAYLVFYLYLHACAARPLMVWDKQIITQVLQLSSKDVMTSVDAGVVNFGDKASDHQKDDWKFTSAEKIEGKKVTTSYTGKILQQATGAEMWKKAARSTLEHSLPASNAQEQVRSTDNNAVEDIDVMDYAQPHRKPPIHNRGT